MNSYNLITILGPTASGKTTLATRLAKEINSEIISADSRQVYRGMDIGTGKDLQDYEVEGEAIPYHLIDIVDAGTKYNVYEYQNDFKKVFIELREQGIVPVLCGGSGLYLEAVLEGYKLIQVPKNEDLRKELEQFTLPELTRKLAGLKPLHNSTDTDTKRRAIRAIEIALYYKEHPEINLDFPAIHSLNIGVKVDRESRRRKITQRLKQRLKEGMLEEVEALINEGIDPQNLIYYGLEYKYVTLYLIGEIEYKEMFEKLNTAIHQFSKRQMTWFRRMERKGIEIHWLEADDPLDDNVQKVVSLLKV